MLRCSPWKGSAIPCGLRLAWPAFRRNAMQEIADDTPQSLELPGNGCQAQQMNPTAVGVQDAETVRADFSDFVAFWQVPERAHHQAANRVELVVGELAVEELVEVLDRRQRLDQEVTT